MPFADPALGAPARASSTCRSARPSTPRPTSSREALAAAADAPGYPLTYGTADLREAVGDVVRRAGAGCPTSTPPACCRPSAPRSSSPGCRPCSASAPGDVVVFPAVAYPTYDVGARLAGATPVAVDALDRPRAATAATTPKLLWLNTPGNPTGQVLGIDAPRARSSPWARQHGVVVASDECYAELDWRARAGRRAADDAERSSTRGSPAARHEGLLAVYSLSKQSNLAGYRAAFVAGDPALVARLLEVRKHAGMIVPWPGPGGHGSPRCRRRRPRRRAEGALRARGAPRCAPAVEACGLRVDHSEAGLYLWATRGRGLLGDRRAAGRPRDPRGAGRRSTARPGASTSGSR